MDGLKVKLVSYDAIADVGHFKRLNEAIDQAKVEVPIDASYDLGYADKAHEHLAGHVLGKIVLRIR